jgi:hypothetical protein
MYHKEVYLRKKQKRSDVKVKIGLFDHEDLVIYKKQELLVHKPSNIGVEFTKAYNETEILENFAKAIKNLEIRVGLWLIDQL